MAQLERDMVDAYRKGRSAALSGTRTEKNPWNAGSELASERVLAKMWRRGHLKGNPVPDSIFDAPEEPSGEFEVD